MYYFYFYYVPEPKKIDRCETAEEATAQVAGQQTGETGNAEQQQVTETLGGDGQQVQQLAAVPGVPDIPLEGITVIPASNQGGWSVCYYFNLLIFYLHELYACIHLPVVCLSFCCLYIYLLIYTLAHLCVFYYLVFFASSFLFLSL